MDEIERRKLEAHERLMREALASHLEMKRWSRRLTDANPDLARDIEFILELGKAARSEIIAEAHRDFFEDGDQ